MINPRYFSVLLLSLSLCNLCSCTAIFSPDEEMNKEQTVHPIDSLELYLSRKSLSKTEFEQFKFSKGQIYGECGTITGGRYFPVLQELRPSSQEQRDAIERHSDRAFALIAKSTLDLDKPGKNTSLFDPGQYLLTLERGGEQVKVETSLDSISEPTSALQKELLQLAQAVRKASRESLGEETLCGNTDFYGVPG